MTSLLTPSIVRASPINSEIRIMTWKFAKAAAPAAEAPKRRRRASEMAAAAAPAPAPVAPTPVQQQAAVQQQVMVPTVIPQASTPATLPAGGWLSMLVPADPSRTAGAAVALVAAQQGGEPNIFPTIFVTGGVSGGGMFDYDEMNEDGSNDSLPSGRDKFAAILLTYRLVVLGWPRGSTGKGGPKVQPKFRGVVASDQGDIADIAATAAKRYQFRLGRPGPENKGAPEPVWDALCHPSMAVEALCFEPEAGIMVVRSTFTYESMTFTNDQINGALPKNEKGVPLIGPTPVTVETHTWKTKGSKGRPEGWDEHGVLFKAATLPLSAEINVAVEAFTSFYQQAGMDQDLAQSTIDWCKHTLSPNDLEILRAITNLPR